MPLALTTKEVQINKNESNWDADQLQGGWQKTLLFHAAQTIATLWKSWAM